MSKTLLIGLLGVMLAGCTRRLTSAEQEYHAVLNRQATARGQGEAKEDVKESEQASLRDLGTPRPGQSLIVMTGPLSQPYETLGEVRADTTGILLSTAGLRDALSRSQFSAPVRDNAPKLSYAQMDELLRMVARQRYGDKVGAVINVTYRTAPGGDVFASGLAVRLMSARPLPVVIPVSKMLEDRLKELRRLREQGLLTPEEYKAKREKLRAEF
jgi:hypothetical protein